MLKRCVVSAFAALPPPPFSHPTISKPREGSNHLTAVYYCCRFYAHLISSHPSCIESRGGGDGFIYLQEFHRTQVVGVYS